MVQGASTFCRTCIDMNFAKITCAAFQPPLMGDSNVYLTRLKSRMGHAPATTPGLEISVHKA